MADLQTLMLAAIPTLYNGVKFRSRTEARWAVFFDELKLEWEYEIEGYQLPSCWYLPDFWFPIIRCFAETKAVTEQWDEIALIKAYELALGSGRPVLMFDLFQSCNPLIPAYVPHATEADKMLVHLPYTIERGRLWTEEEVPIDSTLDMWGGACETARAKRFGQG